MISSLQLECHYCHEPFAWERKRGILPRYCSPTHRQMAYMQRRALEQYTKFDPTSRKLAQLEEQYDRLLTLTCQILDERQGPELVSDFKATWSRSSEP